MLYSKIFLIPIPNVPTRSELSDISVLVQTFGLHKDIKHTPPNTDVYLQPFERSAVVLYSYLITKILNKTYNNDLTTEEKNLIHAPIWSFPISAAYPVVLLCFINYL